MKLHSLRVENFRAIKDSGKLDFTDSLSKPRTVTLIVGPNGSGKTSILDAIQVVVKCLENPQHPELREGLEFSVQQLVYSNSRVNKHARIEFEYSIEQDEALAINEVFRALNFRDLPFNDNKITIPPVTSSSTITWQYPPSNTWERKSFSNFVSPRESAKVLGVRGQLKRATSLNKVSKNMFERIGGICYLDQRRSLKLVKSFSKENEDSLPYDDVLSWLREFYLKDKTWSPEKYGESYWAKIKRLFNKICYPTELIGLESGDDSDTLILRKNHVEYDLSQMSSGEHQILRILVGLVSERAKNSIVLIDEVELHLHPAWQTKLIQTLREDKENNNQYIFTTHSPFVKQIFYNDEIIDLGDLGE
ncbi:MAG: ATP-binding protein [Methylococcales bacterium]|nr:ATP-binding protein [Methylococcales bacterium]